MSQRIFRAMVLGPALEQRSKCSFPHPITGDMVTIKEVNDSNGCQQGLIKAMLADAPAEPLDESIKVELVIYVSRSMDHYEAGGGLTSGAPSFPKSGKNIAQVAGEALNAAQLAGWLADDSSIAEFRVRRRYTFDVLEPERVEVTMTLLDDVKEDVKTGVRLRGE